MRTVVLSSGSKGNVTYLEINNKKFLLDAGRNYKYISDSLKKIDINVRDIEYIVITHNHDDHISALKTLLSKTNAWVIISSKQISEIECLKGYEKIIVCDEEIEKDNINILSFRSSHDAVDSRNYVISSNGVSIGYVTDTGYINKKNFKYLTNLDVYLFESNHDIELLQHGPYPEFLKRRVLSDEGHLSNKLSAFYLSKLVGNNTKEIVLIHLSETNNNPEIALNEVNNTFKENGINIENISCAKQNERSKIIDIQENSVIFTK